MAPLPIACLRVHMDTLIILAPTKLTPPIAPPAVEAPQRDTAAAWMAPQVTDDRGPEAGGMVTRDGSGTYSHTCGSTPHCPKSFAPQAIRPPPHVTRQEKQSPAATFATQTRDAMEAEWDMFSMSEGGDDDGDDDGEERDEEDRGHDVLAFEKGSEAKESLSCPALNGVSAHDSCDKVSVHVNLISMECEEATHGQADSSRAPTLAAARSPLAHTASCTPPGRPLAGAKSGRAPPSP
eukprot:CAMPEP_0114110588 /NCGR_PEP_ID=MMETSP0043_2-20121206/1388_1 /TAXON_ID=464988 /ORGANISM="Hemiselmis andersenii, Strain CCMP644" /LENGTH=236 /DNA_ID=CAMNT_0001202539 /DNA_START=44 /DNA_END=753 /DNA_ORIENTATION=+